MSHDEIHSQCCECNRFAPMDQLLVHRKFTNFDLERVSVLLLFACRCGVHFAIGYEEIARGMLESRVARQIL